MFKASVLLRHEFLSHIFYILGMGNDGAMKYIKNGGTMEKPNECPESIHNLMRNCWRQLPEDRPTFIDICQHLLPHSNQR